MKNFKKLAAVLLAAALLVSGCISQSDDGVVSREEIISSGSSSGPESGAAAEGSQAEGPSTGESQGEEASQATGSQGTDDWRLRLVNAAHPLEAELDVQLAEVGGYSVDARIADAANAMLAAARESGISLTVISGYRTMERSGILYSNKVQEYLNAGYSQSDAEAEAAKWVAPPGTSEHHTGLAMDIISADYYTKYNDLVEAFENEPEAVWMRENCADFGFILRYPKDKEEVTGIHYEPWHFRYVGEEAAREIMSQGICLEEYLGQD